MTVKNKKKAAVILACGAGFFLAFCPKPPFCVNFSDSVAHGIYGTHPASAAKKDGYAVICLPEKTSSLAAERHYVKSRGDCPDGRGALLKRIAGTAGDFVSVSEKGISVNGKILRDSAPVPADGKGRPLPVFRMDGRVLGEGEFIAYGDGDSGNSFDSRYFGPVSAESIRAAAEPLWVWGNNE